jgi:hypothetical protein
MKFGKLTGGIVTSTTGNAAAGYVEIPDQADCGWQLNGQTWEKSAALIASEAAATALATKRSNVTQAVSSLRTWATEAQSASGNWGTRTQVQKDAIMVTTFSRLSTLMDRFADLVEGNRL